MLKLSDPDIRKALYQKRFQAQLASGSAIVVDELGLAHAKSRIDVAVINGSIHGYEIKSERDTLKRLESQVAIYRQTLQRLTFVVASKHVEPVMLNTPDWCGVVQAKQGPRCGVGLTTLRSSRLNPDVNAVMMAHLLWHSEVAQLLRDQGCQKSDLRRPRKELYELLCERLSISELASSIREVMSNRRGWRDHLVRV